MPGLAEQGAAGLDDGPDRQADRLVVDELDVPVLGTVGHQRQAPQQGVEQRDLQAVTQHMLPSEGAVGQVHDGPDGALGEHRGCVGKPETTPYSDKPRKASGSSDARPKPTLRATNCLMPTYTSTKNSTNTQRGV